MHQVVAQRYCQDGDCGDVKQRIELTHLADEWDCVEVPVEQLLRVARETAFDLTAAVVDAREGHKCELALNEQKDGAQKV